MTYTVAKLHKALGELIDAGHGRKQVHIDKGSFRHALEGDGVTILPVHGLGIERVPLADGDGAILLNADGTEATRARLVLAGDMRADTKGRLLPPSNYRGSPFVSVAPCVTCLDKARDEGREEASE